jgi:probable addiction module antidote protein
MIHEVKRRRVTYYRDRDGSEPFKKWLNSLEDGPLRTRIFTRIERTESRRKGILTALTAFFRSFKMPLGTNFQDHLQEELRKPHFAAEYIMAAIEENDPDYLNQAIGNVVKAYGVSKISRDCGLTRQALYKMFSPKGNPTLANVHAILGAIGLKIVIAPQKKKRSA